MGTTLVAIGGSDAGISAALRARELDPTAEVTVVLADQYPNFSICGIPYYVSGDVGHWRDLAHRSLADLEATGMALRLDTCVREIEVGGRRVTLADGASLDYDALIIGTGAVPVRPPIGGLDRLGVEDGVHLLHSMGDTFAVMRALEQPGVERAVIVGAGYIGLEMAEAFSARGLAVTQIEQLPEVLPTVDPELGALVRMELERNDVDVRCGTRVDAIAGAPQGSRGRLEVHATGPDEEPLAVPADLVLVVGRGPPGQRACGGRRSGARRQGRDRRRSGHAHQPPGRVRRRRLRRHPPPPARRELPPAGDDRPQAGAGCRGERARRNAASSPAASGPKW